MAWIFAKEIERASFDMSTKTSGRFGQCRRQIPVAPRCVFSLFDRLFGYGLSYTSFGYELNGVYTQIDDDGNVTGQALTSSSLTADDLSSSTDSAATIDTLYLSVTVKNTGKVAGKETVEVYVEAPYTSGGTEKAYLTLAGFGKTETIAANGTDTIVIPVNVQDFASYDYSDANSDDHTGYELDPGDYTIHVMGSSSHENISAATDTTHEDAYEAFDFTLEGTAHLDLDDYTGNEIENLFSGSDGVADTGDEWKDDYYSNYAGAIAGTMYTPLDEAKDSTKKSTLLSRADFDGTMPTPASEANDGKGGVITSSYGSSLDEIRAWWGSDMYMYADTNTSIDTGAVWEKKATDIPTGWTQGTGASGENYATTGMYAIALNDMVGVDLNDSKWDEFMNRLTWDEMCRDF